jgi:hypothetical protein
MPPWLISTLQALPALLWIVAGLGVPWALLVLPRRDWRDRVMVAGLALAFGPALLTAWMFILGTLGMDDNPHAGDTPNPMQTTIIHHSGGVDLLRPELILAGTLALAVLGVALAWAKARRTAADTAPAHERPPLFVDEKLLIALIIIATLARWGVTAWLPFGSWDPLWVYGYQGRVYTLTGYIPADIGYYPQFLPLLYAFSQIVSAGGIDDHAARAALPFLQIGSILMVYLLGSRLFAGILAYPQARRLGIIAAALWALYPHFGYWTRIGDLEIPQTFAFTGAAAFFLMAWTQPSAATFTRRRYALIAGLFFGLAMWIKPTAGAFVWGVLLLLAVELIRRRDWRAWWPRFEVTLITGLACLPLGAVWYARNVLLGHDAVNFPPAFWLTQAMRSGAEFGWPLLALALLLAYVFFGPVRARPDVRGALVGLALVVAGVLPSIVQPGRMGPLEWLALAAGVALLAWTLGRHARRHLDAPGREILARLAWAELLALPYFATWFYSYSYHYRLSFPIVPLLLLPTAVILTLWFTPARIRGWARPRRIVYLLLVLAVALPGAGIALYDEARGWGWPWRENGGVVRAQSLQGVVGTLQTYIDERDDPPVVIAPGAQQLPFYFPLVEIRITETPRRINQLAGATHFIHSQESLLAYAADGGGAPYHNQWLSSLRRENVATQIASFSDPSFFYEIYELHIDQRFEPVPAEQPAEAEVRFGDFARYTGHTASSHRLDDGDIALTIIWQALDAAPEDYVLFIHLIDPDDPDQVYAWGDGPVAPWHLGYYSTRFWESDEFIIDRRTLSLPAADLLPGEYRLRIGWYDVDSGARVPVSVDGQPAGDGYLLETVFSYRR